MKIGIATHFWQYRWLPIERRLLFTGSYVSGESVTVTPVDVTAVPSSVSV